MDCSIKICITNKNVKQDTHTKKKTTAEQTCRKNLDRFCALCKLLVCLADGMQALHNPCQFVHLPTTQHMSQLSLSLSLPPQKEKSNKHSHLSAVLSQQACQRQWHSPCGRGRTPPSTRCCCCSRVQPSASPAPQAAVVPGPHGTAAQCTRAARPPRSVRLRCPVMASSLAPSFSSSPSITHSQRGKK